MEYITFSLSLVSKKAFLWSYLFTFFLSDCVAAKGGESVEAGSTHWWGLPQPGRILKFARILQIGRTLQLGRVLQFGMIMQTGKTFQLGMVMVVGRVPQIGKVHQFGLPSGKLIALASKIS